MPKPSRAWIYLGLGAALAGAASCVGLVELMSGPTLKPGDRVLLIGDSLAVGLAVPLGSLCKDHKLAFQGIGKIGTRIDQWANSADLAAAIEVFKPTVILVSLGTNDAYMMAPPEPADRQAQAFVDLLGRLEGSGARAIVWLEPPTLPPAAKGLPGIRALIESGRRRARVSIYASQKLTLPRGPDGIHPVASGYALWAGSLWQWLT